MAFAQKTCLAIHPPGRKVYQRGAHVIWQVDGAKDKVGGLVPAITNHSLTF